MVKKNYWKVRWYLNCCVSSYAVCTICVINTLEHNWSNGDVIQTIVAQKWLHMVVRYIEDSTFPIFKLIAPGEDIWK